MVKTGQFTTMYGRQGYSSKTANIALVGL